MSDAPEMIAERRDRVKTGGAREARRGGRVPGILYGNNLPPVPISVAFEPLQKGITTQGFMSHPLDLKLDGETIRVLPRAVQRHPVTDFAIHVDFMRISGTGMLTVDVPISCDNAEKSPGIKRGGILNLIHSTLEVVCPAMAVPDSLRVDLTGLALGDVLTASAVRLPPGVKLTLQDLGEPIVSIAPPITGEKAETAPEGEEVE